MRADARAKRAALQTAGAELFAEQGTDVPLSAVAVRAGVGIGTLYRHFPTRGELYLGVMEAVVEKVEAAAAELETAWDQDPRATWQAAAHELGRLRIGALVEGADPRRKAAFEEAGWDRVLQLRDRLFDRLGALLRRGKEAGLVREDLSPAQFYFGLAVVTRPLPETMTQTMPVDLSWLVGAYFHGLRP